MSASAELGCDRIIRSESQKSNRGWDCTPYSGAIFTAPADADIGGYQTFRRDLNFFVRAT